MAVTKTKFINYVRCPRYVALDDIKKEKLEANVTIEEYRASEKEEVIRELMDGMFDSDGVDVIDKISDNMEVMLPYYNRIELLAGSLAHKYFKGKFTYAWDTKNQESFDFSVNGIKYLCYVDIYNEVDDHFNIIEVKATTSKKFLELGKKIDGKLIPIFYLGKDNIYHLLEEDTIDDMSIEDYNKIRSKLLDKYSSVGHYIYDIAVQRYIIENDLKSHNVEDKNIRYYLAVLNSSYIFDGKYLNGEAIYETGKNGDIIIYFVVTNLTIDLQESIDLDRRKVESYIYDLKID